MYFLPKGKKRLLNQQFRKWMKLNNAYLKSLKWKHFYEVREDAYHTIFFVKSNS